MAWPGNNFIPRHTGPDGDLTKLLNKLKNLRDEHVRNTYEAQQDWFSSLFSSSESTILISLGVVLGAAMLIAVSCCLACWIQRMKPTLPGAAAQATRQNADGKNVVMIYKITSLPEVQVKGDDAYQTERRFQEPLI